MAEAFTDHAPTRDSGGDVSGVGGHRCSAWRGWPRLVVSFALAGLVVLLWVRSRSHADYGVLFVPGGAAQGAASVRGRVLVVFSNISLGRERGLSVDGGSVGPDEFEPVWDLFYGAVTPRHELRGVVGYAVGPAGSVVPLGSHVAVLLPHWLLLAVALVPGARWLRGALRRRRWLRTGRCPHCGYDVRSSRERCPECGEWLDPAALPAGSRAMRVMAALAVAAVLLAAAAVAASWNRSPARDEGGESLIADAEAKLAQPVYGFPEQPMTFEQFVNELHRRVGVVVVVDWNALQAAGVDRTTTIDLDNVNGDSGAEILTSVAAWLPANGGIGYATYGRTALITSKDELGRRAVLRCYDVRDLVAKELPGRQTRDATSGSPGDGDPQERRCHELVALAERWTRELTATRAAYRGSYRCFDGWLVAVQDENVHRQLRQWLKWIRTPEPQQPSTSRPAVQGEESISDGST